MDFIQSTNKQVDKFGPGEHGFSEGNPSGGVPATFMSPAWCDDVQMSLINLVKAGGLAPTAGTPTLVRQAVDIMIRRRTGGFCAAGGTVDAITGAFTPAVPALVDGLTVAVRCGGANTSATPTFKADGTAATTIVKDNNKPLLPGDIAGAGYWMILVYDATLARWVLSNPAANRAGGYMMVRDEKPAATDGGNSIVGSQVRTLNTVVSNNIPGASLAANKITLTSAGRYRFRAIVPGIPNVHRAVLYNVTDAAVAILGQSCNSSSGGDPVITTCEVVGTVTIAGARDFEVRHYCSEARTNGLGAAVNDGFGVEVYTIVEVWKLD